MDFGKPLKSPVVSWHVQNPVQNKFNNLEDDHFFKKHLTRTDGHNISDQFIVGSFVFLPLF